MEKLPRNVKVALSSEAATAAPLFEVPRSAFIHHNMEI